MQETRASENSTGGVLEEVLFPRSTIYVSTNAEKTDTRFTYQTKEGSFHFFLLLNAGSLYTRDLVDRCEGRLCCFNCTRPIVGKVFFFPEQAAGDKFVCSALPHCRVECAHRTVEDRRTNHDLKTLFYLMHGTVRCAPSRTLLYMPGKLSVDDYHAALDDQEVSGDESELRCYNCDGVLSDRIVQIPQRFTKAGQPVFGQLPHCREACALRTINDIPHNGALKVAFFRQFGNQFRAAPPRSLLYIPNAIGLQIYHDLVDRSLVVEIESSSVRAFMAPTFVSTTFLTGHTLAPDSQQLLQQFEPQGATSDSSHGLRLLDSATILGPMYVTCTCLSNYQLVPDVLALIEEMGIESKTAAGPGRTRDNSKLSVVELTTQDLRKTRLSETFSIDPASSRGS
jgi:hypothetical protein